MRLQLIVVSCVGAVVAGSASAQLGPAGAGRMASASNASTVNSNPAGIMRLEQLDLALDAIVAASFAQFDVDDSASTETGGNPKNDPDVVGIPAFGIAAPIGEWFAVGLGFSIPTGFGSDYGDDWAGRYLAEESQLVFMSLQPVVAVRPVDWLAVSAGAAIQYTKSYTKVAINQGPGQRDGRLELDVDGVSAGPLLGFLVEVSPTFRFGVSWRGEIDPKLSGKPDFQKLTPELQTLVDVLGLNSHINLKMRSPQNVGAGFLWQATDDLVLTGDFNWIDWSRFGRVEIAISDLSSTVRTNYNDIYVGTLGLEYRFNERYSGGIGFTYVSSGVSNKNRTLSFPLDEYYVGGIGLSTRLTESMDLQTNFDVVVGGDGSIDEGEPGSRTGRLVGSFDRRVTFALQLSFVWRP
jgi:long-chain fatty acid transport protein